MIYGARIKQVREFHNWIQHDLAERIKKSQSFLAQVETHWSKAPDDLVSALVFQSGFPPSFFEQPPDDGFPLGSLLFRAHADMPEREQRAMHRHAEMAYEVVRRMLRHVRLKEVPLRVPRSQGDPERAAVLARSEFGLGADTPVRNVIETVERAGVLVIALPRSFVKGDAFSAWAQTDDGQSRPIIVLSADRPADRLRMSCAHELGHLVMHQPAIGTEKEMENEAKEFASAFLMPADAMRHEFVLPLTLDSFVNRKVKWGVAISALIVRAQRLGIITPRKYKTLYETLSSRGWIKHEPLSLQVPLEKPRAVRQIAEILFGRKIDYARVASLVDYPEWFVKELIEAHATVPKIAAPTPGDTPTPTNGVLAFKKKR